MHCEPGIVYSLYFSSLLKSTSSKSDLLFNIQSAKSVTNTLSALPTVESAISFSLTFIAVPP